MAGAKVDACLYLMRHGCTALDAEHRSDGWLDMSLSPEGQLSIIPAQQYLKAIPLYSIYAPTLKRTTETAEIIASSNLGDPDIEESDEAKTWNLGTLAGTRKQYGRPAVTRLVNNPTKAPLGGESYNDFTERFLPWFQDRLDEALENEDPCLIVFSGSNLRCVGKHLFDDEDAIDLDEGGLVVLRHSGDEWHDEVLLGGKRDKGRAGGGYSDAQDGAVKELDKALKGG